MPYKTDLLLQYRDLPQLRRDLRHLDDVAVTDIKQLRYHTTADTRVRVMYTYFFLGKTQTVIAQVFWVLQTTISNWIRKLFEPNDVMVAKSRTILDEADGTFIEAVLTQRPLLFLHEITKLVHTYRQKKVHPSTIHRSLVRERKWTRRRAQVIVKRARASLIHLFSTTFRNNFGVVVHRQLIFINELSFKVESSQRTHGRSPKEQMVAETRSKFKERQVSFMVAMGVDG
ncbi:hypothetical protein GEMRC1_000039 [Eukaryota sp. GEM-RC1]